MNIHPQTKDAYRLFHEGILALGRAEQAGMRVDIEYCERKKAWLTRKIDRLERKIRESSFGQKWKQSVGGKKINLNSNAQLGRFLYQVQKIKPSRFTDSGQPATDEEALSELGVPELDMILEMRKLRKIRDTYLDAFVREQVNGWIHPFFNLHLTKTYRSCVAKGTKILIVRDFEKYPNGVPIEDVRVGDYVYCFDNELNPAIRKVLWAGKTGHREVIRVHWSANGGGGKGYLDVTPEHLIRLIDGTYKQAQELDPKYADFRSENDSPHLAKVRVLSCSRKGDSLRFTGHLKYGNGIREHRLVYQHFNGDLSSKEIIHHKNGRHLDHAPKNLEKTTHAEHASYHSKNVSEEIYRKRVECLRANQHKIRYKSGFEHHESLKLTKFDCLRELVRLKGQISKTKYDFDTFKKYVHFHGIDPWAVRRRYDKEGKYITLKRLQELPQPIKIGEISRRFGLNYKNAQLMLKERKIEYVPPGPARNPYGRRGIPGNHTITKIEWIGKKVDVYDIEVEDFHNFFANEICVHNSSDSPNFQNIPKRDKEAMKICRGALFPRLGHQFVSMDYSGIEVRMACVYTEDEKLIQDTLHGDMHKDMAIELYMLDDLDKRHSGEAVLRQGGKNGFVFPQFYGDYYGNCAPNLLKWAKKAYLQDDTPALIHLKDKRLITLDKAGNVRNFDRFLEHVKKVEDQFWNVRYRKYTRWKDRTWREYQRKGYIDMKTGFRCSGLMNKKDVTNYPFQGTAFHCLLWSFIEIDKAFQEQGMNSRLVSQVHDEVTADVPPEECEKATSLMARISREDIRRAWDWIIIPLDVEAEKAEVDKSWGEREFFPLP